MLFRKEKPLSAAETPAEPEKTPKYSGETSQMIEAIDTGIESSQSLLGGLDRLAKEQIIKDSEGLQEIYAPKQIGKLNLEKYDAGAFETAGKGLRRREAIRSAINFGVYGSKYALENDEGIVDVRKLKEEAKERKNPLSGEEFKKLKKDAKKFGLNPKEIKPDDFKTTIVEGKKGKSAEKVILQRKTEEEMIKTAGEIMERRLKELESGAGAELIKKKESLDKFREEKKPYEEEQYKNVMPPEILEKLKREEIDRRETIKQEQEVLNGELDVFRQPLLEHREDIAFSLSRFPLLLEDLTAQEKTYQQEITNLEKTITGVEGSKELIKVLGDNIKDWEEQKTQTEANLKDFREKKEALNKRISELKTSQAEVDAALERINNIGKTKTEQAEAKKQKREEQGRQREAERERRRREREQQRPWNIAQQSNRLDTGENQEKTDQTVGQSIPNQNAQASAPAAKNSQQKPAEKKLAKAKIESNPPANFVETEQKNKENTVKEVSKWLNLLGINNAVGTAKTAVENNFKISEKFDLTKPMTLGRARRAYTQYLIDFLHYGDDFAEPKAQKQAQAKFKKIIENLE